MNIKSEAPVHWAPLSSLVPEHETKKTKRLQVIGTEANLNEVMKKNYL